MIVAIDPGLDCTGYAVYGEERRPDGQLDLRRTGSWATEPGQPLPARLEVLAAAVTALAEELDENSEDLVTWVIERPARKAVYARQGGRDRGAAIARGMGDLHMAIGALVVAAQTTAACNAGVVELIEAPRVAKGTKQMRARVLLSNAGLGHGNADLRDAVWLGAYWLTRGRN